MEPQKLIRSGVANDAGHLRPTLRHCLEATLSIADSMVDEMLERLAQVLVPEQEVPLPVELKDIDLMQLAGWIEHADDVKLTWRSVLTQLFFHGDVCDVDVRLVIRFDELSFLDDNQMGATIEFAMVEQVLISATGEFLPRLNSLVSTLMGWLTVQPELNPIRPAAYARALHVVMVEHIADAKQRKLLLMPLANVLATSLIQVYREVIQWLMAHGVQPTQVPTKLLKPEQMKKTGVGRTMLTMGHLRQLLSGNLNEVAMDGPADWHTVPASLSALEDMNLIEPLMQRLRQRPMRDVDAPPVARLPVVAGHKLGRLLGQEVVRLMLENLTLDERLLPAFRQQIALLEPSLTHLAKTEPRFFSDRQHPARQLLEAISQRSLGFISDEDDGFAEFLKSVRSAVKSIDKVEATEEKFARLLKRLRRLWQDDDERKNQRRAEASRALMHAEQRQILAERLTADFRLRMQDKDLPGFVSNFVCGPWAQAMAEAQMAGVPSDEVPWTVVAEDLIWSAQPCLIRRDVDRLERLLPRLLSQLRQGLQQIHYPAALTGRFFDALVNLHESAIEAHPTLSGQKGTSDALSPQTRNQVSDASAHHQPGGGFQASFWMVDQEAQDAGYLGEEAACFEQEALHKLPTEMVTGAWVNLKAQGGWVRAQLTWTSPRGGLYMFISATGMAHSMTHRTLDRLLASSTLQMVASGGVVEGALDAVAQQALRNTPNDPPDIDLSAGG